MNPTNNAHGQLFICELCVTPESTNIHTEKHQSAAGFPHVGQCSAHDAGRQSAKLSNERVI